MWRAAWSGNTACVSGRLLNCTVHHKRRESVRYGKQFPWFLTPKNKSRKIRGLVGKMVTGPDRWQESTHWKSIEIRIEGTRERSSNINILHFDFIFMTTSTSNCSNPQSVESTTHIPHWYQYHYLLKTSCTLRHHTTSKRNLTKLMAFQKMSNFTEHMRSPDERVFVEEPEVSTTTVGSYLAQRLVEAGASTFFTVPGDYILGLLDSLLKNKGLKMVGCCNELNGGYAGTRSSLGATSNTVFPDNPITFT